jgi:hypothetical protein
LSFFTFPAARSTRDRPRPIAPDGRRCNAAAFRDA